MGAVVSAGPGWRRPVLRFYRRPAVQFGLLAFDLASVAFFLATMPFGDAAWIRVVDYGIAVVIAADLAVRVLASTRRERFFLDVLNLADVLVLVSLIVPAFVDDVLFLRILRVVRLFRSYHLLREMGRFVPLVRTNHEMIGAIVNLGVFVFVVTAFVYVFQVNTNPAINNYFDALYFTVTTLTTTGFGDIVPAGTEGRIVAVVIMVVGVALFLRLVQTIFRPAKVTYPCPRCGLRRHDPDAVHCKHCGEVIRIGTEGEG